MKLQVRYPISIITSESYHNKGIIKENDSGIVIVTDIYEIKLSTKYINIFKKHYFNIILCVLLTIHRRSK